MKTEVRIHPAAELFPLMSKAELAMLVEDIRENAVRTPLQFLGDSWEDAQLLDGRNRLLALKELGIGYRDHAVLVPVEEIGDPIAHVLSLNLHRRHLTDSQRGMVAAKVANLKLGDNQHSSIDLPSSQAEAATQLNVSVPTVKRARKVQQNAVAEIAEAVERGEISVSAAAEVSKLPHEEQARLVAAGPKAVKAEAAVLRTQKPKVPAADESELDCEPVSQFDPSQFDEALRDPKAVRDVSKHWTSADKLILQMVPGADALIKVLERAMNDIDAINAVTPLQSHKSFTAHYQRAHGCLTTARETCQHMTRSWVSVQKKESFKQGEENRDAK